MHNNFFIGDFEIGGGEVFIIAELSANHNGSLENAIETIRAAKRAGANCIKLQTYTPDTITLDSKKDDFRIKGTIWDGEYLHDLYQKAFTPWEWHKILFETARSEGLTVFSSPFDNSAVDLLESLNCPAYKIASFEITDIPLIKYVASKGKPVIMSTGIASKDDIELAIRTCRDEGNNQIALLKCTSSYPAPIEDANLATMSRFREDFGVIPGLSDHTLDNVVPVVSTALGAKIIEKHFIINRDIGGPDASFSLDFDMFKKMVDEVRAAERAIGRGDYPVTDKMRESRAHSRSLYFVKDIGVGEIITQNHVKSIRPGFGAHPKYYDDVIGTTVKKEHSKGDRVILDEL